MPCKGPSPSIITPINNITPGHLPEPNGFVLMIYCSTLERWNHKVVPVCSVKNNFFKSNAHASMYEFYFSHEHKGDFQMYLGDWISLYLIWISMQFVAGYQLAYLAPSHYLNHMINQCKYSSSPRALNKTTALQPQCDWRPASDISSPASERRENNCICVFFKLHFRVDILRTSTETYPMLT